MLLSVEHLAKTMGPKILFTDLNFHIDPGEKIALIGRNGQGKTTLLQILGGLDREYHGEVRMRNNLQVILTRQEHLTDNTQPALEYILKSVPHFHKYEKILKDFEDGLHMDVDLYSEAVEHFSQHEYFFIKDVILGTLASFQIDRKKATVNSLNSLSGGEKRFVELVRMMYAQADLLLIDEPTNHMDYLGKEKFIAWMKKVKESLVVVTHDRDILQHVDKIFEMKDKNISVFNGNYDHYLQQNTSQTTSSVVMYQNQLNRLAEAKKRVEWGQKMKAKSKAWKIRCDHWVKDYERIKAATVKPSFWIDQESTEDLDQKVAEVYEKFKEKNISISLNLEKEYTSELVRIENLSLGYEQPVFSTININLLYGDRVFVKGKNGAGKSTLVKTLVALYKKKTPQAKIFKGEIKLGVSLRLGEYEQEINPDFLHHRLGDAIRMIYEENKLPIDEQKIKKILAQYLFDPYTDDRQKVEALSGGQKARFQIIKMLANKPNLLVLDEPTNHLDLPSIEELENALQSYEGGIIYISHDNYFVKNMGGTVVEI